jgi:predicted nucleic acid-binding protein
VYILDTNILLAYIRLGRLYTSLETSYSLWTAAPSPVISVVTEGEIRALAEELFWGSQKKQLMALLLARFTAVPLPYSNVLDKYVEIAEYSRRNGRTMGKNDLWIAATAASTGATLLTTDRDFDHLNPVFITCHWIDPTI